jgi:uncharacterized protein with PIN domain
MPPRDLASPYPRLFADAMLGALARWLRALDLDVAYDPGLDDAELVEAAVAEGRTILTRDRRLVLRRRARNHLLIRSDEIGEQVRQVVADLDLHPDPGRFLARCLRCNVPLENVPAAEACERVPPFVARTQQEFRHCPACGRLYWRATHAERMRERLEQMLEGPRPAR